VNYSQDDKTFAAGMKIIAEEVKRAGGMKRQATIGFKW